jgi:uncharacterized protein (TIGR00369 family)
MLAIRAVRGLLCGSHATSQIRALSTASEERFLGYPRGVFIHIAEEACPFIGKMLEPKVTQLSAGELIMELPFKEDFIGNPVNGVLHGGVTAALIDHVGGFCAMSSVPDANLLLSTVDLRIDYLSPAPPEALVCHAWVTSRKKTLVRSDIECWNADRTVKIATGRALYSLYPSKIQLGDIENK